MKDIKQLGVDITCEGDDGLACIVSTRGKDFAVIVSWGGGWEHVSVHIKGQTRCPTWEEMCFIKNIFWNTNECVIQYHPANADYINVHKYVLHLWKPIGIAVPTPPKIFV